MASTHDLTKWTPAHPYAQQECPGRAYLKSAVFDAAKCNVGAGDTVELISIPANSFVAMVRYEVLTPEGATLTFDVGDGATPAGFVSNANGNSAGAEGVSAPVALTEGTPNTLTGYSGGKYYAAADTLDLVCDNAADAVKIKVQALIFDFN